VTESLN